MKMPLPKMNTNKENTGKCCCTGKNFGRRDSRPALATLSQNYGNETTALMENKTSTSVKSKMTPIKPSQHRVSLSSKTPNKVFALKVTPNAPVKPRTPTQIRPMVTPKINLSKRTPTQILPKLMVTPSIDLSKVKPKVNSWMSNSVAKRTLNTTFGKVRSASTSTLPSLNMRVASTIKPAKAVSSTPIASSTTKKVGTAIKTNASSSTKYTASSTINVATRIKSASSTKKTSSPAVSVASATKMNALSPTKYVAALASSTLNVATTIKSTSTSTKSTESTVVPVLSSTTNDASSNISSTTSKSTNQSDSGFSSNDSSMFTDPQGHKQSVSKFLEECAQKFQSADILFGAAKVVATPKLPVPMINVSEAVTLPDEKFFSISQDTTGESSMFKNVAMVRDTSLVVIDEEKSFIDALKFFDDKETAFPLLYVPDYFEDMILYCKQNKDNLLPNSALVELYTDKRARTLTVNWLHQVADYFLPQFDLVYFPAVRLFDYVVVKLKLCRAQYQLAAIVSLKIALKFLDSVGSDRMKVSKMYSLCKGKFSTKEISKMEVRICEIIGFKFGIVDPMDLVHYYLKKDGFHNDEDLKQTVCFILECATLFNNFCSTDSPLLAGIALFIAQQHFSNCQLDQLKLDFVFYQSCTIQSYIDSLKTSVKMAIKEKYNPAQKYSTTDVLCFINSL